MNYFEKVRNMVDEYVSRNGIETIMSRSEFIDWVHEKYNAISIEKNNLYPTDISYNLYNAGLKDFPGPNLCLWWEKTNDCFRLVGSHYKPNGEVIQYKGTKNEKVIGSWKDGEFSFANAKQKREAGKTSKNTDSIKAKNDKKGNQTDKQQREWIFPCNTSFYDIENALKNLKIIDWKQSNQLNNAQVGDLIYIYCKGKKSSEIRYKGAILKTNKTDGYIDDSKYSSDGVLTVGPCIEIAVFREYELKDNLTYAKLKEHGLLSKLQGPTVVKDSVAEYLHQCDEMQRQVDRFLRDIPDTCLFPFPIVVNEIYSEKKTYPTALDDTHSDEEKEKHAQGLSIEELKQIAQGQSTKSPKQVTSTVVQTVRDPYIAEYAKKRAKGICQLCGNKAPFNRANGEPYLESHHIIWLSKGGADSVENTVALCPNCHKKMHIVNDDSDVQKLVKSNEQ